MVAQLRPGIHTYIQNPIVILHWRNPAQLLSGAGQSYIAERNRSLVRLKSNALFAIVKNFVINRQRMKIGKPVLYQAQAVQLS